MIHLISQGMKHRRNGIGPFMTYLKFGMERAGIPFRFWTMSRNETIDDILAEKGPKILVHTNYQSHSEADQMRMLEAGCYRIVHNSTEQDNLKVLSMYPGNKTFVIRESYASRYPGSMFLPHPITAKRIEPKRKWRGMSFTRVTSRKNIELIMEANLFLRKEPVQFRGEISRLYAFHFLRKHFGDPPWPGFLPDNEMAYEPDETGELAASTEIAFNLTKPWKGDGGGSEYATLFGLKAGCITAVSADWLKAWKTPMEDYVFPISSAEDIIDLMRDRSIKAPDATDYLRKHHDPKTVARILADFVASEL